MPMRILSLLSRPRNRSVVLALVPFTLWLHHAGAQPVEVPTYLIPAADAQSWNDNFRPANLENLVEQGQLSLSQGRLQEAEEAFSQAMQVSRAVDGLQNAGQLPILDRLLGTLLISERWVEFDRQLDYLAWLTGRIYTGDAEQLAAGYLQQSDWHRAAAAAIRGQQSAWYLVQAKFLNWQAVSVLEESFGQHDPRLVPVLHRIAMDHYYQAVSIERRGMTSFEFKSEDKVVANGWSFSKNETVRRSYRIGRDNLRRIETLVRAGSEAATVAGALARVQRADWEFVFGNNAAAMSLYRDAYYELLGTGLGEPEVDRYFARAVVLPEVEPLHGLPVRTNEDGESSVLFEAWSPVYPGAPAPIESRFSAAAVALSDERVSALVLVRLDGELSQGLAGQKYEYGVTGMEILQLTPRNETLITRLFEVVPRLKFRPRLEAGKLANHEPVTLNYVFAVD